MLGDNYGWIMDSSAKVQELKGVAKCCFIEKNEYGNKEHMTKTSDYFAGSIYTQLINSDLGVIRNCSFECNLAYFPHGSASKTIGCNLPFNDVSRPTVENYSVNGDATTVEVQTRTCAPYDVFEMC
jgi:hypothetical protein